MLLSHWVEHRTGVALPAIIAWPELRMVLALGAIGLLPAAIPALSVYRQSVSAIPRS